MRNRQSNIKFGIQQTKARAASYAISGAESGVAFSNAGAPGAITFTLPRATVGEEFWFHIVVAQALIVQAGPADTMFPKGAGSSFTDTTIGDTLWVKCVIAGAWWLVGNSGWT